MGLVGTGTGRVWGTLPKPIPVPRVWRVFTYLNFHLNIILFYINEEGKTPPRCIRSYSAWLVVVMKVMNHGAFEWGRGGGVVLTERTPPSCNLSEGGVDGWFWHPPSHNLSEGGVEGWFWQREPLHLAIWAREGLVVACQQKKHTLHLTFQAREGVGGCSNTTKRDVSFLIM